MSRVIAVTGAGRGLGHSVVKRHLGLGDTVYAFDYQITDNLKALAAAHDALRIYRCDISSNEDVIEATRELLRTEKKVDIIYNVAGIFKFEEKVGLAETDMDLCLLMYNVNALGAMRICKSLWPLLGKGSLVMNISSESGSIGAARRTQEYGYGMSKAAMNMGAKLLSNELWAREARVMSIHPGWLRTDMGGAEAFKSDKSVSPDESAENIVNIALNIDTIPRDQMFMQHTGEILPW
ncbi:MAG: SDR family oxidoreductase [Treponema sp.]|jgi:NAD(P)-dependent dehydrogenase (short-subunit alcohol dehydrogenase family)|nr:SDR family oxidoreductase [Treponema sp.]